MYIYACKLCILSDHLFKHITHVFVLYTNFIYMHRILWTPMKINHDIVVRNQAEEDGLLKLFSTKAYR